MGGFYFVKERITMLAENEARAIMAEQRMERDILETRSCAEIVEALGLVSAVASLEVAPVMSENAKLQAASMTQNVRPDRPPYFVR
jgi:hypothetical protein